MAKKPNIDLSTEEKIKEAARLVFTKKGFAATRTRDIAQQAGINLALLNYYFRSKEKLFEFVMLENAHKFFSSMKDALNDPGTSIEEKIEVVVGKYVDLFATEPNLPFFIVTEIHNNPERLVKSLDGKNFIPNSVFFKQLLEYMMKNKISMHPLHFIVNMISLTVFPFLAKPMLQMLTQVPDTDFSELMEQRKKLVPAWIKAAMQAK